MKKNKLILFVLALILLAGIIIVCLKGFKVSLDLRAHDTLKFVFDKKFEMSDITKACDEVFKDKEYKIKTVEVFSDAIYIISPEITESEEESLLEKLDELYPSDNKESDSTNEVSNETEETTVGTEDSSETTEETIFDKLEKGSKYDLYHDSKIRIRDVIKPYIIPSIICAVIIAIYVGIKYRKLGNGLVVVCKLFGELLIILLEIMSIIAIARIPFTPTVIPIVMFIIIISLCIKLSIFEKKLEKLDE